MNTTVTARCPYCSQEYHLPQSVMSDVRTCGVCHNDFELHAVQGLKITSINVSFEDVMILGLKIIAAQLILALPFVLIWLLSLVLR